MTALRPNLGRFGFARGYASANTADTLITSEGLKAWLVLLDVDEFKQVNYTFGHDAGDTLLLTLAERFLIPA